MDLRSMIHLRLRRGLTPYRFAALYVAALLCFMASLILLPYSRAVEAVVLVWCWIFLIAAIVILAWTMIVFGLALCRTTRGRIRGILAPPKGVARRARLRPPGPDPLWDRWTDG